MQKNRKINLNKFIIVKLKTPVDIPEYGLEITYKDNIFFIGSCFTEHIGKRLTDYAFSSIVNPFGAVYNPVSVANSLNIIIDKKIFTEKDLFHYNGVWFSFFHNTSFSYSDKNQCLDNINRAIHDAHFFLKKTDYLFITLGTAYVYEKKEEKYVVSNCHKLPPKHFNRYLLDVDDICNSLNNLISRLKEFNPGLKIVFTVSPVRHLKDGAQGNLLSKSTLVLASQKVKTRHENIFYFPAYEIMMDELRDYRFYNPDMVHLNIVAIDYIWEKFMHGFFSKDTRQAVSEIEKLYKAKIHKPVNRTSQAYKDFLTESLERTTALRKKYPAIKLERYIKYFKGELDAI